MLFALSQLILVINKNQRLQIDVLNQASAVSLI